MSVKNKVVLTGDCCMFSLSDKAISLYKELSGNTEWDGKYCDSTPRHDPILVKVVERLGNEAGSYSSSLEIEEIDGNMYTIDECGGYEILKNS